MAVAEGQWWRVLVLMPKKPKTRRHRYHLRNWPQYNRALKARGSLTLWLDESAIRHWIQPPRVGERRPPGHPVIYSDLAIRCLLTLRAVFHLPLRATEGFARSVLALLRLAGPLPTPDFSTLARRAQRLTVELHVPHPKEPLHLVVDATGLKCYGEGEWKVKQHGWVKHRRWRKLHLMTDRTTLLIRGVTTSGEHASDSQELGTLLGQEPEPVATVKGDTAYDTHAAYAAVAARAEQPRAIFLPRRARRAGTRPRPDRGHPRVEGQRVNRGGYRSRIWQHGNCHAPPLDRDEHIRRIRAVGRQRWKEEVGYHERNLAETTVFRFKTLFGPALSARDERSRATEVRLKGAALNRMTRLGMPDSFPVQAA